MPFLLFPDKLFKFGKTPDNTVDDIRSVSVSCGHMDCSHCYSFHLRKSKFGWIFDAEYAEDTGSPLTSYEECTVTAEDAKELLNTVLKQNLPAKLKSYKKPKIKAFALDETTYYTSIAFANGTTLGAPIPSEDTEACFYRLAKKIRRQISADKQLIFSKHESI